MANILDQSQESMFYTGCITKCSFKTHLRFLESYIEARLFYTTIDVWSTECTLQWSATQTYMDPSNYYRTKSTPAMEGLSPGASNPGWIFPRDRPSFPGRPLGVPWRKKTGCNHSPVDYRSVFVVKCLMATVKSRVEITQLIIVASTQHSYQELFKIWTFEFRFSSPAIYFFQLCTRCWWYQFIIWNIYYVLISFSISMYAA
jgi:hypothetical protein